MKEINIEQVIETVVRTGEQNQFYRVQVCDELDTNVWVGDFKKISTVGGVIEHCAHNMDGDDLHFMYSKLESLGYFTYNGETHFPFEMNVVLSDYSQDRYKSLNDVADVLEENYKNKFGIGIKLLGEYPDNERGFSFTINWDLVSEADKDLLWQRGYNEDAEANTDLLIKELNCSLRVIHNLKDLI